MRFYKITIFLFFQSLGVYGQQGRAEMPVDTIPLGGKQEEVGMTQMEGHDELEAEMMALSDSVSNFLKKPEIVGASSVEYRKLADMHKQFLETLHELRKSEKNSDAMRRGYKQSDELRAKFYSLYHP